MPVAVDLAESFGLLIGNPQNEDSGSTPVPATRYFGPSAGDTSGNDETMEFPGEDTAAAMRSRDGDPMPCFPGAALRPRLYSATELIDDWRQVNTWAVDQDLREIASAHETHRTAASQYARPETTTAFWRYMYEFDELQERFDEFLVHRINFVKKSGSDQVYTVAVWAGPCQEIFPPVDYFLIPRELRSFFGLRRKERFFLTEARKVLDLLRPGLESYEAIPGTYLITAETLINSEEGGIMDLAQDFFDTAQFSPEDGDIEFVTVDEFVDTGLLNTD
jgi:hypothetical protein